jgi:hypothetical protein
MAGPCEIANCQTVDDEMDRSFSNPGHTWSEATRKHLTECSRCRALHELVATRESISLEGPAPAVYAHIGEQLKRSLQPVVPQPSVRGLAARFCAMFILFALPAVAMMGIAGLKEMTASQMMGMAVVFCAGIALLSVSLAWQMTPGSLQRISARTALGLVAVGFLAGTLLLFPWGAAEAFWVRGWACLQGGLMTAIPAAVLFWLLARRGAGLTPEALGGMLGALAGFMGATVLQFTCSRHEASHLLVWHGGVLLLSIFAGTAVGRVMSRFGHSPAHNTSL